MPVWGPILVFSELTAAFLSQTATGVTLNHHQINYLCYLSPMFLLPWPASPPPSPQAHVLWINNQPLQFGRGHPWDAGRDIQSQLRTSPRSPRKPRGSVSLEDALGGWEHPHQSATSSERCLNCSPSQFLLAKDKVTPHFNSLQMWLGGK